MPPRIPEESLAAVEQAVAHPEAGNRVEGVGGLGWFSSEFRQGMTPTTTNLIPLA
jgi:hypothetical protein